MDFKSLRVLLITPPMTQLNTPFPATAYLTGFLRDQKFKNVMQADPGIELVCRLFSKHGLERIRKAILKKEILSERLEFFLDAFEDYQSTVELVLALLQGKDSSLTHRIANRQLLPEGPRFASLSENENLDQAFGVLGVADRAKYIATLYIDDLVDVIREGVDERFAFSRYGEKLSASQPDFKVLQNALKTKTVVDEILEEITNEYCEKFNPDVVGFSIPFPGNVYGALRMGSVFKSKKPETKILWGGGYVNTELRELSDSAVFDYTDLILLDDGERPLLCALEYLAGVRSQDRLLRTFIRDKNKVKWLNTKTEHDIPFKDTGMPTYDGLRLDLYLSVLEMLNPMHRLWSDTRWNKITAAHGCYWKKCSFCDVNLDYIGRYDPISADLIIDRMQSMINETGMRGFHFVDEAAPPATLKSLSKRLIERKVIASWWGNIRFDKAFTNETAKLMADSGCIAVSGGLEVASDRLLKLMQKGVTVEQVARVTRGFREAGILVHAYLMYGFPTQTVQETIDSLERVRQLFVSGCIQSAYWHRFSATVHSPIGKNPEKYGIRLLEMPKSTFAKNDLDFEDPTDCDHDLLGVGLNRALYNYMHGVGLDEDVRVWFDAYEDELGREVPPTTVDPDLIANALGHLQAEPNGFNMPESCENQR